MEGQEHLQTFGDEVGETEYERTRYSHLDQRLIDRREKVIVKELLSGLKSRLILDLPSGYGRFTPILREYGDYVVSADLSLREVRRARERAGGKGGFLVADIKALPFKPGSIDLTFSMRIFQHMGSEGRSQALSELSRVARRWVLLSFYCFAPVHFWARKLRGLRRHIRMTSLLDFLQEVGSQGLRALAAKRPIPLFHSQVIVLLKKCPS